MGTASKMGVMAMGKRALTTGARLGMKHASKGARIAVSQAKKHGPKLAKKAVEKAIEHASKEGPKWMVNQVNRRVKEARKRRAARRKRNQVGKGAKRLLGASVRTRKRKTPRRLRGRRIQRGGNMIGALTGVYHTLKGAGEYARHLPKDSFFRRSTTLPHFLQKTMYYNH